MAVETVGFTKTVELRGDVDRDSEDTAKGFRIFLGQHVASVSSGEFSGTDCVVTGSSLGFYVKRDGKAIVTVAIDLRSLFQAAIDIATETE